MYSVHVINRYQPRITYQDAEQAQSLVIVTKGDSPPLEIVQRDRLLSWSSFIAVGGYYGISKLSRFRFFEKNRRSNNVWIKRGRRASAFYPLTKERHGWVHLRQRHGVACVWAGADPANADGAGSARENGRPAGCAELSWKVRSARDRTIRTFQIGVRSKFFQNSGIFARKFKNFGKFQHFLKYRRNSDKISSKSEQKSMKRIQK